MQMMIDNINKIKANKTEYISFLIIVFILILEILRLGDLPGLYMDAIMSDYASARFIYQQQYSHSYFGIVGNLQLTGSLYHGNFTMLWTLFVSLLTGHTSVLQYRIGTAVWCILILGCMQYILTKCNLPKMLKYSILLIIVLAPSFVTTIFTQYYSFLPGTFFVLLSFILIERWIEKTCGETIFFAAFFLGLAIYSYFIFAIYAVLFMIIMIFYSMKKDRIVADNIFSYIAGVFSGVLLYIIGFYSIGIAGLTLDENIKKIFFGLVILCLLLISVFSYKISLQKGQRLKKVILILIMISAAAVSGLLIIRIPSVLSVLLAKFNPTAANNHLTIFERLNRVLHHISAFMRDSRREYGILGYTTSRFSAFWRNSYFVGTVLWVLHYIYLKICDRERNSVIKRSIKILLFLQIGFIALSMIIVGGLNPHHYTTFYVISILMMGLIIYDIQISVKETISRSQAFRYGIGIWLLLVIAINFINTGVLTAHINLTGGHRYYTNQTTELAKQAIEAQHNGVRQFYIFPEWGFVNSFEYLTGNTIPFAIALYDMEYLQGKIEEGYEQIILAYFDQNRANEYVEFFGDYQDDIEVRTWYTLDGQDAFVTLTLDLRDREQLQEDEDEVDHTDTMLQ